MAMKTDRPLRTKVVATIGPSTNTPETLPELLDTGVDVCRLNFSHGTLDTHAVTLKLIRDWERSRGRTVAVLGDLCGPKIRLNIVRGNAIDLKAGEELRFVRGTGECVPGRFTVNYAQFIDEVEAGQRIYIDDGLVRLLVLDKRDDQVHAVVKVGGMVSSRKGVNLPDTKLSVPALTPKDRTDLEWAVRNGLDYVALSFVRRPEDVAELRAVRDSLRSNVPVIVKIEKSDALRNLDEILGLADGAMVARGDLGVEMDIWRVPVVQKLITLKCREQGKPVIVATQMLQSMVTSPMPTRAEVSDVANAIFDGTDAVMLSAETASGAYPVGAVDMMRRTAGAAEDLLGTFPQPEMPRTVSRNPQLSAIARGAVEAAALVDARLIAVWTATGETVRHIARHRLTRPVIGLTPSEAVSRRLCLLHGVTPLLIEPLESVSLMKRIMEARLLDRGLVKRSDRIIVVTSTTPLSPGTTDTMLIHEVEG